MINIYDHDHKLIKPFLKKFSSVILSNCSIIIIIIIIMVFHILIAAYNGIYEAMHDKNLDRRY